MSEATDRGLLIFDLDGTLFRTETVTVPAVRRSFQEWEIPIPPEEEILSFFGKPGSEFHAWIRARCPQKSASDLLDAIDRCELDFVSERGQLYPQVREVLGELRSATGQMALCTNGGQEYVERVISVHGIEGFFDAVRYRRSEGDAKPAMVRELLERLDSRPAFVIGDRADDIEAAHENGIRAIGAAYGYGLADELACADATAGAPSDLPGRVRSLLGKQMTG